MSNLVEALKSLVDGFFASTHFKTQLRSKTLKFSFEQSLQNTFSSILLFAVVNLHRN